MSKIDQLLAKAMSTSSEDEAISCLRMARKQGSSTSYKSNIEEDPSLEKIKADLRKAVSAAQTWANMYGSEAEAKRKYQRQNTELNKILKDVNDRKTRDKFIIAVLLVLAFTLGATIFPPEIVKACILF